jgi:trimeric autotransporter adhesin
MGKTRQSADLVSDNNIFVDIINDRVGMGKTNPSTKLDVNGVITCTDLNSTSDINLKTDIAPLKNSIEKLLEITGVSFFWKETQEPSIGVIAQELEKVFPELVRETEENKTVNYNGLIGVLIEAVKEQQNQINTLKNEIEMLKNER